MNFFMVNAVEIEDVYWSSVCHKQRQRKFFVLLSHQTWVTLPTNGILTVCLDAAIYNSRVALITSSISLDVTIICDAESVRINMVSATACAI